MSLRRKTALLITLLVVLFFTLAGFLSLQLIQSSLTKSIHEEFKTISVVQSQAISTFLQDTLRDAQAMASFLPPEALEEKNFSLIQDRLKTLYDIYPKFENGMFLLDEKGNLWVDYPVHSDFRGKNFSHREYFKTTMEKKKGAIGAPYRSTRTGMPVITFTAPLKGTKDQIVGLLGCSVQLSHPNTLGGIGKIRIGETGYLYLLDASGSIIFHPDEGKVFQSTGLPVSDLGEGIRETIDSKGNAILLSLKSIPETSWILVVQQNKSEAFASIHTTRKRILWITLFIGVISVLIGNFAVRRLTIPLQTLQKIINDYGEYICSSVKGEYQERLASLASHDEIGSLAKAFSEMATKLDQTYLQLKTANQDWERTFSAVHDPIFLLDRENRVLRINRAASELMGISQEKAIGKPCYQLVHGTDRPLPHCPHQQTLATGKITLLEVEEPFLNRIFEVTTAPLFDERENIIGTVHIMRDITKRMQDEMRLEESEKRYRTLVESARDVIITLSPDGKITSLNSAFEAVSGWKCEEWLGKSFLPIIHPQDRERSINLFNRALQGEKLPPFELRFQHPSGTYGVGEFTAVSLSLEDHPQSVLAIARDITQRKRDEEILRLSEEKFSKTFHASPIWLTIASLQEGRYIEANEAFLKGTGYRLEEVIGKTSLELKIWNDPEDRVAFVSELQTKGSVKNREVKFRDKSGRLRDILISAELIEIGIEKYILGAALDITDRKRMEASLRASEEKYRSLVENTSDAIILLDLERRILSCNQAFSNLFGYTPDEIEGESIQKIHPSEDSFHTIGKIAYPVVHQKGTFKGEWNLVRKNGEVIPVEVVISSIRTLEGSVSGYVSSLRDITDRRKMEYEKSLLEEQLRQSQKMEAIGILAGGIAHDFNNLLTIIQGNSEILLFELSENHPLKKGIEEISGAARRAADLTRQLLAFSRRQILEPKIIDLNEIVGNLNKMLKRIIGEDIKLVTTLARDLGSVKADPSQIEQVILNIAVNARDAMPKGGTLTIETANVEIDEHYARTHISVIPGYYVMLSIGDTGVGMSPEVAKKVFEPFFTTKEIGKGTGLGLSTVYGIVKQSGGNIWVYSELNKGTTFKIYLPRVDEMPKDIQKPKELSAIPRGTETVLLVEDDENVRMMTARILTQFGYRVLSASDAPQAIRLFKQEKDSIDIILTDVVMPTMSGRDMIKQMHIHCSDMKVLYMSGYTNDAIAHHGVLEEGVDYIQKPFTLENLLHKIREVLDRSY